MKNRLCLTAALILATSCVGDGETVVHRNARSGVVEVIQEPSCADCEIVLREIASLGATEDPVSIAEDAEVTPCVLGQLAAGGFVVSAPTGGTELLFYDEDGRLSRRVGRSGEGPGEFGSRLVVAVAPGDTVYVADRSNARITVLAPTDSTVRTIPVQSRVTMLATLDTGMLLLNRSVSGGDEPLDPLEVIRSDGSHVRSFGRYAGEPNAWGDQWVMSPTSAGGSWSGKIDRFEASEWSADGQLIRTLVWNVDWFPAGADLDPGFPQTAPAPAALLHLRQQSPDTLWVFVLVPDARWEPGKVEYNDVNPESTRLLFDTHVEVLDLTDARVIARARFDEIMSPACNGQRIVYHGEYAPDGDIRLKVVRAYPRKVGYAAGCSSSA